MRNSLPLSQLSYFVPALLVGIALLGGLENSHAINSTASGNWSDTSIWSDVVPGTSGGADAAVILGATTVTVNTTVPAGPGSVNTLVVANSSGSVGVGTLLITTGGSLTVNATTRVMAANANLVGATGVMNMTGGSASFNTQFTVGLGTGAQSGNGSGTVNLSGASSLAVAGNVILGSTTRALGTGNLNIIGSAVNLSNGADLTVNRFGNINFTFDSTGISDCTVTGVGTFNASSNIVINAGSFAGAGIFTLIDAASFVGTPIITLNGFGAGSSYDWNTTTGVLSVNVTAVPEPSTWALLGLGAMALGFVAYRKRAQA